jgi:hypothetical protein
MIVFDLKCLDLGHVFEAWFGSTDDYEDQRRRGLVQCPLCGTERIEKAVMAPRVGAKGNQAVQAVADEGLSVSSDPEVKAMLAAVVEMQKKLLENSSYVGDRFAEEARAIHLGEADGRPIHGRATREQAESLIEEGIAVAPLPFPVAEPNSKN